MNPLDLDRNWDVNIQIKAYPILPSYCAHFFVKVGMVLRVEYIILPDAVIIKNIFLTDLAQQIYTEKIAKN